MKECQQLSSCPISLSPNVTIREIQINDAVTVWQAIENHRDYLKIWLPFAATLSLTDENAFISAILAVPYEERNIVFVIEEDSIFCGLIGFINGDDKNHRTELGYWLLPEYQGKGIMTLCVKYLCQWAVGERGFNRIQIKCAVNNHPSNAIPRRLGFILEGTERDGELLASGLYTDIHVYSILKREIKLWNNNRF